MTNPPPDNHPPATEVTIDNTRFTPGKFEISTQGNGRVQVNGYTADIDGIRFGFDLVEFRPPEACDGGGWKATELTTGRAIGYSSHNELHQAANHVRDWITSCGGPDKARQIAADEVRRVKETKAKAGNP